MPKPNDADLQETERILHGDQAPTPRVPHSERQKEPGTEPDVSKPGETLPVDRRGKQWKVGGLSEEAKEQIAPKLRRRPHQTD